MKIVAFASTLILTAAGALLAGRASDDFTLAMVVTAAWFAVVSAVAVILVRRRPALLLPIGAALGLVVVVMTVVIGIPTLIGKTVDETVAVTAGGNVQRATGSFVSIAHEGRGKAAVVELADGSRKLTITSFETDSGPDLRVYLSTGDPADGELEDFVDLGALKGNRGNQQYEVPTGVDLSSIASR